MRRSHHHFSRPFKFLKAATKQFSHIAFHKILLLRSYRARAVKCCVYFYPELPHPYTVCYRMLHLLGIPIKRGLPRKPSLCLVFLWQDETFMPALNLLKTEGKEIFINLSCTDISKENVERVHRAVFGYSLEVNPKNFLGKMVVKSNTNGAHDGRETIGPLREVHQGLVYQRVVNNQPPFLPTNVSMADVVCDIRVPIFSGNTPFAYLKYRPKSDRFSNTNSSVYIVDVASVFNHAEWEQLCLFCKEFGLDYGEIDVVRDADDGKIYVLDVNKTPLGPPNGLSAEDQRRAINLYHQAFLNWFDGLGVLTSHKS